jgi:ferric-dicitrate binding protein FerR (iron transport regulator)
MSLQEAQQFVANFINGDYAPGDYAAFLRWLKEATTEELNVIADTHESFHANWAFSEGPSPEWVVRLEEKLDRTIGEGKDKMWLYEPEEESVGEWAEERAEVLRMPSGGKRRRNVWLAAASVLILVSAGTYIYVRQLGNGSGELQGRERALARTFTNPRGGGAKEFVLDDGSKVLLNAASTLKYPARFTEQERLVELSGEAFFDVAGNSVSPFRVLIKDAEVEVLGTQFNVMAYDDEPVSRTTVVDGAVKVKSGDQSVTLQPGQQAAITYPSSGADMLINVQSGIDPGKVLAWKSGSFAFVQTDLRTIMRSVGRSYNVEVQYEPNVPNPTISCAFPREGGLHKALNGLEGFLKDNHFNIRLKNEGKTVIVTAI